MIIIITLFPTSIRELHRKETYEVFYPKAFATAENCYFPWKENTWVEEVTERLPEDKPRSYPPKVKIQVNEVTHITHCEQFRKILERGRLQFKANEKLGRMNSYLTKDGEMGKSVHGVALLPGNYSWWGIELPSGFPPPQLEGQCDGLRPILSPLFKPSESIYGTVKIKTMFSELKRSYCQSRLASLGRSIGPGSVKVGFKIGGTLFYKREVCFVIIMYMKRDPRAEANLDEYPDCDFDNELTIFRPFSRVEYDERCIPSSWDTYVFALFFPLEESEALLQMNREQLNLSLVSHYNFDSNGKRIRYGSLENNICHSSKKVGHCPDRKLDCIPIDDLRHELERGGTTTISGRGVVTRW